MSVIYGRCYSPVSPDIGVIIMRRVSQFVNLFLVASIMMIANAAFAETRTARNGDTAIEYQIDGKGPVILMIPSLGRPTSDFDDLSSHLVAAGYTTIRPQPRGMAGSTGVMKGITLNDLAADAIAPVPADSGPIVVIGHAFGQRVARILAAQYPDRVKSVIMVAAGGKAAMLPGAREALTAVFDPTLSPEKHIEAVRFAFFAAGNDPLVWRGGWNQEVAQMQEAATKASPVDNWWGAGRASLLVIQGLQDVVAPPENGRKIKDEFGDRVTLHNIDGAGHALLPEKPKEIAALIQNFLSQSDK
jgi:pimeloyl-ACP methyl ester carboxylesterase